MLQVPVKMYSGRDCVKGHTDEICSYGSRALIVTGRHSAEKNGSLADITSALDSRQVKWAVFSEIEENPSVETVMKARDFGIREGVDFVIGIGGGSPMDAAKAIALMIYNKEENADWLYNADAAKSSYALPVICVPTTCGTGSEVTAISVLTRHDLHTKKSIPHRIFAEVALIDGKYLVHAPKRMILNTSMDALAHLYESYINSKATDTSRAYADSGLKLWARNKPVILEKCGPDTPGDAAAVTADEGTWLLNASMMAGIAIAYTGTAIPHGLSYALTYNAHMAHGKACGYFLPGYLREADPKDAEHVLKLSGFDSVEDLEQYYEATCGRDEVPEDILELSVQDLLGSPSKMAAAPFPADEAVLRRIVFGTH